MTINNQKQPVKRFFRRGFKEEKETFEEQC